MKALILAAGLVTGLLGVVPDAMARGGPPHAREYYDHAMVVSSRPVYETVRVVTPRNECWDEYVTHYDGGPPDSYTGTIVGGIVGGVVGNQFGSGRGKDVATVAGTLLGASVGRDLSRRPSQPYTTVQQHCRVVEEYHHHKQITGYDVTYRYRGQLYTTRMGYDPGRKLRVRVTEHPARYRVQPAPKGRR
jgi:uncharacterized protein YcfJ